MEDIEIEPVAWMVQPKIDPNAIWQPAPSLEVLDDLSNWNVRPIEIKGK